MPYQASVFDTNSDKKGNELAAPLLPEDDEEGGREDAFGPKYRRQVQQKAFAGDGVDEGDSKLSFLLLGMLVGFVIQLGTLGANYVLIALWGTNILSKSKTDIAVASMLLSLFASGMAALILYLLQQIVDLSFRVGRQASAATTATSHSDDVLEAMVANMDCRFVVGALVGVCIAWTLMDALFVCSSVAHILNSLIALAVELVWCRAMMLFMNAGSSSQNIQEHEGENIDDEEEEIEAVDQ